MQEVVRNLNAVLVLILSGILISAFGVQFFWHEEPCPLCMLQRLGMIGVSIGALLNMKFGVKTSHYGLSLLACLMGGTVALRQISLHVCPGFSTFGIPVLGLSLYTWSFLTFACAVLYIAILLFIEIPDKTTQVVPKMNKLENFAFVIIFLITAVNVVTTFLQCGFGPCTD